MREIDGVAEKKQEKVGDSEAERQKVCKDKHKSVSSWNSKRSFFSNLTGHNSKTFAERKKTREKRVRGKERDKYTDGEKGKQRKREKETGRTENMERGNNDE